VREYSATVIDHFSNPRSLGPMAHPDATAEVASPCCGDRLRLEARIVDGRVAACAFLAYGCAPAIAVGSLLTEAVAGRALGDLAGFDEAGVAGLAGGLTPHQRHCALLGRDAVRALVENYGSTHPEGGSS
jgi:nitrogen fixation protein NifU and related proteins